VGRPSAGEAASLRPRTADLLRHPAFATWFVQSEAVFKAAARLGWGALFHGRPGISPAVAELVGGHFSPEATARYCRRLEGMAEWLWLAGDEGTASLALAAAATLGDGPPENHPLAGRMVQAGLAFALQSLAVDAHRLR
jgi:hypothetical protein